MGSSIRESDRSWEYDWTLHDITDGDGRPQTVPATEILRASDIRAVAVCLHCQEGRPIYLIGDDNRLYYHHYSDEFVNQLVPMDDFLRWKNYWYTSDWTKIENPPVRLPKGWFVQGVIGETVLFISGEIIDAFREAVRQFRGKLERMYFTSYDIYQNFPHVIEIALRIKAGHP